MIRFRSFAVSLEQRRHVTACSLNVKRANGHGQNRSNERSDIKGKRNQKRRDVEYLVEVLQEDFRKHKVASHQYGVQRSDCAKEGERD
jgi:hypothetical protein